MSDPFVGEIRMFAGNWNTPPKDWAFCNGQTLPISSNTALYSLLGTMYGGDGTTNFGLPNLQDRFPINRGQGPGLSNYPQGGAGGATSVTLALAEMPGHGHAANAVAAVGSDASPANTIWAGEARRGGGGDYAPVPISTQMSSQALVPAGGNQPHENTQPYLAVRYIIALYGVFPSRP